MVSLNGVPRLAYRSRPLLAVRALRLHRMVHDEASPFQQLVERQDFRVSRLPPVALEGAELSLARPAR